MNLLSDVRLSIVPVLIRLGLLAGLAGPALLPWPGAAGSVRAETVTADACVVLLHGLARTSGSMTPVEEFLGEAGYRVVNQGYDSRKKPISELASAVEQGNRECREAGSRTVHFVTHSLGGILVRWYRKHNPGFEIGRLVMLGPPNRGSHVVDKYGELEAFRAFNGPAGSELGTGSDSVPNRLGPVDFETAVIAGNHTVNLWLSKILPGADDGKVSVSHTRVDGMCAFLELPVSHTFMMYDAVVLAQIQVFLETGRFSHGAAEDLPCAIRSSSGR